MVISRCDTRVKITANLRSGEVSFRIVFYPHRYPLWRRGKLSYGRYPRWLPWTTGEEGGAKKSGGPLRQIVRTGLVCLCCDALYSRGPQSINARLAWAQTRHNSRESIGIRDALIMYAVRIEIRSNSSASWTLAPSRMIPRRSTCGVESAERLPQRVIRERKCRAE